MATVEEPLVESGQTIHCVFYSHVWLVEDIVDALCPAENDRALLVELAVVSNIAVTLDTHGETRLGLAGLLQGNASIESAGEVFKGLKFPILFPPRPAVPIPTLESAVSTLTTSTSSFNKIILLVHVNDCAKFSMAYHYSDKFSIFWDVADPPTIALATVAETLQQNSCVDSDSWEGIFLLNNKRRRFDGAAERAETLNQIIGRFDRIQKKQTPDHIIVG